MAATRLIALHINKGKTVAATLKQRLDYSQNPEKTEGKQYVSAYECDPETAWQEFDLSQKDYARIVGREGQVKVIAYQIRQSFKPGEVTPEEANRIGYETAMRFTKGRHAFTVSTHTDRAHIHNHIIFNSVTLDSGHRWRNFYFSGLALQHLSDLICLEHHLSVIIPRKPGERGPSSLYLSNASKRSRIREDISLILKENPADMEELLQELHKKGYEIKRGKYVSVWLPNSRNFIRFRSLGPGFTEEDIEKILRGDMQIPPLRQAKYQRRTASVPAISSAAQPLQIDLLIDIRKKLAEGKGKGYEYWATAYNNKQQAKILLFLQDNNIRSVEELSEKTKEVVYHYDSLALSVKMKEGRLKEIAAIKKSLIDYSKTKEVYAGYRKSGYSRKYFEAHREEIEKHKSAKKAFDQFPKGRIPKIRDLNAEYAEILEDVKQERRELKAARDDMKLYVNAQKDVRMILGDENEKPKHEKSI